MKKITILLSFLITTFLCSTAVSAQSYKSAIGARLGYPVALSYKVFLNETAALELYGSYRKRSFRSFGYRYSYTIYGIGGTYQIHNDLSSIAAGLQWFYGGGAGLGFFKWSDDDFFKDESNLGLSIHASVGLDYRFDNVPINLSLDWKPIFAISGYGNGFGAGYGALSVRYILGE